MYRFLAAAVLVAIAARPAAAGDAYTKCVPFDDELVPAAPPRIERAAVQDHSCQIILAQQNENKNDKADTWKDCAAVVPLKAKVIAFCKSPLDKESVSPEDIEAVRRAFEETDVANKCVASGRAGTVQSLGLPFQDAVLRGIAEFVVARAKAEAMAFLVDRLGTQLCGVGEAKELLPASCKLLVDTKEAPTWGVLKAAFETDLDRLPERGLVCVATRGRAPPEVQRLLYQGAQAARLIYEGNDPLHVVAGFATTRPADCQAKPVDCALYMMGFSVRLLAPRDTEGDIEPIDNTERFVKIAARRWWDEMVAAKLASGDLPAQAAKVEEQLRVIHTRVRTIAQTLKELKTHLATSEKKVDALPIVARLTRATIALLDDATRLAKEFGPDGVKKRITAIESKLSSAIKIVEQALDAYDKIAGREYAHAYVAVALAWGALQVAGMGEKLDAKLGKYMPFIAEVAAAKSADDVKRAIETAAAPVGGGKAKRGTSHRTVAVTAFAGGTVGKEWAYKVGEMSSKATQAGLFVPIGVDVSWGVCKHLSLGGFVSVLDLGAITNFRFDDDAMVEDEPEIGFKQVVSPGAYFVLGIDRFAIGAGMSLAPELRKVSDGTTVTGTASALRFGVFAAIDVTLFPF
jgi:hypothetical protein